MIKQCTICGNDFDAPTNNAKEQHVVFNTVVIFFIAHLFNRTEFNINLEFIDDL